MIPYSIHRYFSLICVQQQGTAHRGVVRYAVWLHGNDSDRKCKTAVLLDQWGWENDPGLAVVMT